MSTKDWIEKDFYKVLGVSKDAKPDEISFAADRARLVELRGE